MGEPRLAAAVREDVAAAPGLAGESCLAAAPREDAAGSAQALALPGLTLAAPGVVASAADTAAGLGWGWLRSGTKPSALNLAYSCL